MDPKEGLADGDEGRYMKEGIRSQVVEVEPVGDITTGRKPAYLGRVSFISGINR